MFYCDDCRKKNNWPESFLRSRGKCEVCGDHASCNDVHHSRLPLPPDAHVKKAMELFGVDQASVTPEMRLIGKAWNFGAAFGATDEKIFGALIDNDMVSTEDGARLLLARFGKPSKALTLVNVDYAELEQRVFASLPEDSPMRQALEGTVTRIKAPLPAGITDTPEVRAKLQAHVESPRRLVANGRLVPAGMEKCFACAHSYMGPGDAELVCGHADAGTMGMYARVASGTGIAAHCGPERPKFKQHPDRNEDGTLK